MSRRHLGRTTAVGFLVAAAVTSTACSYNGVETKVCGTIAQTPIRVEDSVCRGLYADDLGTPVFSAQSGWVRWYVADRRCLDTDDATGLGESLDDDYLGEECEQEFYGGGVWTTREKAPTTKATPTTKPTTTKPRPTR